MLLLYLKCKEMTDGENALLTLGFLQLHYFVFQYFKDVILIGTIKLSSQRGSLDDQTHLKTTKM